MIQLFGWGFCRPHELVVLYLYLSIYVPTKYKVRTAKTDYIKDKKEEKRCRTSKLYGHHTALLTCYQVEWT